MSKPSEQKSALVENMLIAIANFERGDLTSNEISSALKMYIAALEDVADRDWVEELRAMRNDVEQTNASFLNSGREVLSDTERYQILGILEGLKIALAAN